MSFGFGWRPYVSVAARRRQAEREARQAQEEGTIAISPVTIEGRKIAKNFWGKSWCMNLERYSDFASRLPRGRSYVCNGLSSTCRSQRAGHGDGQRLRALRREGHHRAGRGAALEGDLPGLRGIDRFAGGAAAGPPRQGRHGSGLPGRRRSVSGAGRDQAVVQLPGLGRHVQARRGGAVRRRRPARRAAAAAVRAARRR